MELKWILAIGFEAAFWLMLATFLVLRYRYEMEGITRAFVIGAVLDTAGIVALGVWDYLETETVSAYTLFVAQSSSTASRPVGTTCAGSTAGWHSGCGRAGA